MRAREPQNKRKNMMTWFAMKADDRRTENPDSATEGKSYFLTKKT